MSWVTVIWSMIAAACLTMAGMQLLVWCNQRTAWANLLFSLTAVSTAAFAGFEVWMMRADTPAEFGMALRWIHIPIWVIIVSLVGFVRLYLRAGRPWLAWTVCGVRTLALILDFVFTPNLNFREITALRHISFLGESVTVAKGVPNPWMVVGSSSFLLFVVFVVDAAITVGRRGRWRLAVVIGGSIVFCILVGAVQSALVIWQVLDWPIMVCFFFMPVVVAMSYEMSRDVLRAAQLLDDLRDGEERMTLAAEAGNLGHWSRDLTRNEIWASENWRRLFGFTNSERLDFNDFLKRLHPDDREAAHRTIAKAIERDGHYEMEFRLVLPDGQMCWIASRGRVQFASDGKPVHVRGVSADITSRKQAEQELMQKRNELAHLSRVTTVSELSGSLAHELNQPLGIILSNAQAAQELLLQTPPVLGEVSEILADIVAADRRAAEIIQRLRALLKRGESSLQPLPLNDLLEEVLRLVNADLIGRGVTVIRDLAPDLPPITGDRVQLQQLTLNLILNAADAMADNAPGTRRLYITTSRDRKSVV